MTVVILLAHPMAPSELLRSAPQVPVQSPRLQQSLDQHWQPWQRGGVIPGSMQTFRI